MNIKDIDFQETPCKFSRSKRVSVFPHRPSGEELPIPKRSSLHRSRVILVVRGNYGNYQADGSIIRASGGGNAALSCQSANFRGRNAGEGNGRVWVGWVVGGRRTKCPTWGAAWFVDTRLYYSYGKDMRVVLCGVFRNWPSVFFSVGEIGAVGPIGCLRRSQISTSVVLNVFFFFGNIKLNFW